MPPCAAMLGCRVGSCLGTMQVTYVGVPSCTNLLLRNIHMKGIDELLVFLASNEEEVSVSLVFTVILVTWTL